MEAGLQIHRTYVCDGALPLGGEYGRGLSKAAGERVEGCDIVTCRQCLLTGLACDFSSFNFYISWYVYLRSSQGPVIFAKHLPPDRTSYAICQERVQDGTTCCYPDICTVIVGRDFCPSNSGRCSWVDDGRVVHFHRISIQGVGTLEYPHRPAVVTDRRWRPLRQRLWKHQVDCTLRVSRDTS